MAASSVWCPGNTGPGGESDDWKVTFFRLGDRYLVTVLSDLEKGVEPDLLAWGPTMVVSSEFEVLATLLS